MTWYRFLIKIIQYICTLIWSRIYTFLLKIKLRINGVQFGNGLTCFNSIPALQINKKSGLVSFGENVLFNSYTDQSWNSKCKLIVLANASLTIGNNSGINGVMIYCSTKIHIGDNVKVGGGTRISDSNHHSTNYLLRRNPKDDAKNVNAAPITIGDDVFIGANCYIGKGVSIGDRSIVAAGSVVVKSIPADEIWGGSPARFIQKIN